MAGLIIHVEGPTEETAVNEVLKQHLEEQGYQYVAPRLIGDPRKKRGGIVGWPVAKREIIRHLKESSNNYVTTMVDYYGLPADGLKAWPGRARAMSLPFAQKASTVENSMMEEVIAEMGVDSFYPNRFVPFVLMHEFEALLFSDCAGFARGIQREDLRVAFQQIRDAFATPEEINDSPVSAPSKRIVQLVPEYQKPLYGALAVIEIGLDQIRAECQHFDDWLKKLESVLA